MPKMILSASIDVKGVVTKPQLDLDYFKVGKAFRVKRITSYDRTTNLPFRFDQVCLIASVSPFSIEFADYEGIERTVTLNNIINGDVKLIELKEDN